MRGRIAFGQRAIAGARDNLAITHNDAADRHLAAFTGGARFGQGHIHKGRHLSSWSGLTRPSTSLSVAVYKGADARHKVYIERK
jgi:hypothetical protein